MGVHVERGAGGPKRATRQSRRVSRRTVGGAGGWMGVEGGVRALRLSLCMASKWLGFACCTVLVMCKSVLILDQWLRFPQ